MLFFKFPSRARVFGGPYLAIAFGILFSVLSLCVLEVACYFLNRSQFRDLFVSKVNFSASSEAHGQHRRFEIPTDFARLRRFTDETVYSPYQPELLDYTENKHLLFDQNRQILPHVKATATVRIKGSGEVLYSVMYNTDRHARRVVPDSREATKTNHLLIFGCSFVFGEGVNDDETLAAEIAKNSKTYRAYNFGVPGSSIAGALQSVRRRESWDGIDQLKGAALYLYFDGHLRRTFGAMSVVGSWGKGLPYFEEDEQGRFRQNGSFASGRPFLTWVYKLAWKLEIAQFFKIDFPAQYHREHLSFFVRMVAAVRDAYQQRFPGNPFYFVFYPGITGQGASVLIPELERAGIHYLDYSQFHLNRVTDKRVRYLYDTHPTAEANRILGEQLVRDLKL